DKLRKSYPFVDMVFGVNSIDLLPTLVCEKLSTRKRFVQIQGEREEIVEEIPIKRDSNFRAWLPIMYGCDNFCSYCIVPYVRGRERSRKSEDIIAEFKGLVADGYKDITLLGQNVNSYGKNLDEKIDFSDLLKLLDEIDGDFRIRFLTSHPKDANRRLIDTIAQSKHICHHLHLPVQSGSDAILVQMNRRYNVEDYLNLINYAKKTIKDMTFSSDIIIGFPGESDDDFEQTMKLVQEAEYAQLFTFIYSKRTGTTAAEMPDPTPYKEKSNRIARVLQAQEIIEDKLCQAMKGSKVRVLVESEGREDGSVAARLDNNMMVELVADIPVGSFANVKIIGSKGSILKGELIN
ncbi:MAG: tRNA (N6-isopentenyl adenosine(37)-C2)-methylthiotransferase MiaB, partial [Oscillospiraceae bacterium]